MLTWTVVIRLTPVAMPTNEMVLKSSAATFSFIQISFPRGYRSFVTSTTIAKVAAAKKVRPQATSKAENDFRAKCAHM
jgi:hypothetical protein